MSTQARYDTSSELLIERCYSGVRLIRPEIRHAHLNLCSVSKMLAMPFNVYFKSAASESVNINTKEMTAMSVGADSAAEMIGKPARAFVTKETLESLIRHDQTVIKQKTMTIQDANFRRQKDDVEIRTIAIKFPWYGLNDEVIGVFGCSIVLDKEKPAALATHLTELMQARLLENPALFNLNPAQSSGRDINNIYFTKREYDVLRLLVTGKTSKELAKDLFLSPRTVEEYIANLKEKVGVTSKSALIEKAIGLFEQW